MNKKRIFSGEKLRGRLNRRKDRRSCCKNTHELKLTLHAKSDVPFFCLWISFPSLSMNNGISRYRKVKGSIELAQELQSLLRREKKMDIITICKNWMAIFCTIYFGKVKNKHAKMWLSKNVGTDRIDESPSLVEIGIIKLELTMQKFHCHYL